VTGAAGSGLAAISGGVGGITVTGTNSLLITTTSAFLVGDTGLGGLSIEDGATAEAQDGLIVANTSGASGSSVEVSGAGSNLEVTGSLVVGDAGSGSLTLSDGASVTAGALDIAAATSGDGDVSLAGTGTTLNVTGALTLGGGGAGELAILGGAQMTVAGGVVGSSDTAPGNLDIEGTGSQLTINAGTLTIGANGPAEFTLGIGAVLSGEVANGPFGVVSEYGNVDPATDPNDGTQNVGFGNSLIYDFYVANSGTIKITSGSATFYSPLVTDETNAQDGSTNGLWVIGAHETLVMNTTSVDQTQTFDFTSPSAAGLVIGQVPQPSTTEFDTFNGQTMPALTGSIAAGSPNVLPGWDAPIENYQSGDVITLQELTYGSATASGDVVTVWSGAGGTGSVLGSLTFLGKNDAPSGADAALAATQINSLACFAAGTRIATEQGWVKVEDLRVGDRVRTVPVVAASVGLSSPSCSGRSSPSSSCPELGGGSDADPNLDQVPRMIPQPAPGRGMTAQTIPRPTQRTAMRVQPNRRPTGETRAEDRAALATGHSAAAQASCEPIVWIGSRTVDCTRQPRPETVWPVRIARGAFGANVPCRELHLSPDHAVFVNGVLIPAKLLINGTSIVQVGRGRVTYHHVELPEHAVILAEGLPVESYLDTGDRMNFDAGGTIRLYPDFTARLAPDAAMLWEANGAAQLVLAGTLLDAARRVTETAPRREPRFAAAPIG
jgi:T5SS/PEP-CTERM-associated repeat protein